MTIKYSDNGLVIVEFEIGVSPYILQDALVLTQDQYDILTVEQIEEMKNQRYQNWYAIVTAPEIPDQTVTE